MKLFSTHSSTTGREHYIEAEEAEIIHTIFNSNPVTNNPFNNMQAWYLDKPALCGLRNRAPWFPEGFQLLLITNDEPGYSPTPVTYFTTVGVCKNCERKRLEKLSAR